MEKLIKENKKLLEEIKNMQKEIDLSTKEIWFNIVYNFIDDGID